VGETTGGGFKTLRGDKTHCFIAITISIQPLVVALKHSEGIKHTVLLQQQ
jgi:hypothetical protein